MTVFIRIGSALVAATLLLIVAIPALSAESRLTAREAQALPAGEWDFADDFLLDPRSSPDWALTSGWGYRRAKNLLKSTSLRNCVARWRGNDQVATGVFETRLKLSPNLLGRPAVAGIVFAASGSSFRYVTITGGENGRVILGQKGPVGSRSTSWKERFTARVPFTGFRSLRVEVAMENVTVYLDGERVVDAYPLEASPGWAGLRTKRTRTSYDFFAYDDGLPTVVDTTAPTVTIFTLPATADSLTVPIAALTATDNVGVTGWFLSESSDVPALDAPGWSLTRPMDFTFAAGGTRTLYAFARDAAGNVSAPASATMTITPAFQEDCDDCHNYSPPPGEGLAPDMLKYWDGKWWDIMMSGSDRRQEGGHGDPNNEPATTCSGLTGCHDLNMSAASHRDGILQGKGTPTVNTYHLRAGFIPADANSTWGVQVAFDDFCFSACHRDIGKFDMRHEQDSTRPPYPPQRSVEFGTHESAPNADALPYPVDEDLSTLASPATPDYAPCISCHDPHGTDTPEVSAGGNNVSNHMLRDMWMDDSVLCTTCH